MVFLVTTKSGLDDVLHINAGRTIVLWLTHNVLMDIEITDLRNAGHSVTVFANQKSNTLQNIPELIVTIEEHHPNHTVWVEF